jgi:very-short-patch-repair endonuclease
MREQFNPQLVRNSDGLGETPAGVDASRRSLIDSAREIWIKRLIDLSRRNSLLYFRLTKGAIELEPETPSELTKLLEGESVRLSKFVPQSEQSKIGSRARTIRRRSIVNLEEKGIQTLFVAMGIATWDMNDGGRPPAAPVLLLPVEIELRGSELQIVQVNRVGDIQFNEVLRHMLEPGLGVNLDIDDLLYEIADESAQVDLDTVYRQISARASDVPGFKIEQRLILSNFSFQKLAMVKDLRDGEQKLYHHDVVAAIAGDMSAREQIRHLQHDINPYQLDQLPPEQEFLLLDADSSQRRVIASVLGGDTGVIQGPPGTGKSQTIANLIAAAAAEGKRVLFVAEKRAALEVVLRRLQHAGLGHLALDLHGADVSRRRLAESVATSLDALRDTPPIDTGRMDREYGYQRELLNLYVKRLHTSHEPSNKSVFSIQGELLRLPPEAVTNTCWYGIDAKKLTLEKFIEVEELLRELGGLVDLFRRTSTSPWRNAALTSTEQIDQANALIGNIGMTRLPQIDASMQHVAQLGLRPPTTMADGDELITLLDEIGATLAIYRVELFSQDLDTLKARLEPAQSGGLGAAKAWFFNSDHRTAEGEIRSLRHKGFTWGKRISAEVVAAADQRRRWNDRCATTNCTIPDADTIHTTHSALVDSLTKLRSDVEDLAGILGRPDLPEWNFIQLEAFLRELQQDSATAYRVLRVSEIEQQITHLGVSAILDELRTDRSLAEYWPQKLEYAYLRSCLQLARSNDPTLATFDGRSHDKHVEDFRNLDLGRLKVASQRVRRAHGERVIEVMNRFPVQNDLVRREAQKRNRHLPLRRLLDKAPDVLTTLAPCWMASPLSVSQLIEAKQYFDVVIFDEASQVLPEDAISALMRARQVVVAGDRHQLPPTTFFAAGEDESENGDDDPSAMEGFESLLDLMAGFVQPWSLDWHYRSRDEALIAFSNRHIYGNRLVSFPGTGHDGKTPTISHVLVPPTLGQDWQQDSSGPEVQRVVELVLDHARSRPDETLGVITMGLRHADRIQAALDEALHQQHGLDAFFSEQQQERFFIKNLERVQGDERDAIILSVGYGKDRSGRLLYRFGPLLREGGERRLNVAITRARNRLTLVSSFDHTDMDPGRTTARGVELLRLYLEYAASNGRIIGDTSTSDVPLNHFEADIYDQLTAKGIHLLPQLGASKYRIDMVAVHPQKPGRFVLAIECDGATYHSSPTARDRDRLRQQHLEGLGWRFHRIWSTDWFMRRDTEIARAVAAYQNAVAAVDREDEQKERLVRNTVSESKSDLPDVDTSTITQATNGRSHRPYIGYNQKIQDYADSDLITLLRWIQSDGQLRTDEELITEMMSELGFKRRGARINERLRRIIKLERKKR